MSADPVDLLSLTRAELTALVAEAGEPRFRADQLARWLHVRAVRDLDAMSDVPKRLRAWLAERTIVRGLRVDLAARSRDGSRKLVLRTAADRPVETVLMPMSAASATTDVTQCVSSQVGCKMGCDFCATARMPFRANLTAGEIVDQVAVGACVRRDDGEQAPAVARDGPLFGLRPHNLVFMGMGEPLDNLEAVLQALRLLTDEALYGFSPRRITLSTAGLVQRLPRLVEAFPGVNLAISVTATTDPVRDRLMPINKGMPIERLLAALADLPPHPHRKLSFEYALLDGVNDTPEDGARLGAMARRLGAHVNAIPFNPWPGSTYGRPSADRIAAFTRALVAAGGEVTLRESKGQDIGAACGQLAGQARTPGA